MTTKELADELKAEEYLESRGWKKFPCERCDGVGSTIGDNWKSGRRWTCFECDGRGYKWIATVSK